MVFREWAFDDFHALDDRARVEHPGLPVILIGHSMGGMIAARYAQRYGDTLTALVLSGPVLGRWDSVAALLDHDEIPDNPIDETNKAEVLADVAAFIDDALR